MKDLLTPNVFRSQKILNAAKHAPYCMMCAKPNDGTIVAAHYQGFRQHELGKGAGIKPTDSATAYLCSKCHDQMDGREHGIVGKMDKSERFLFAIVKTHDWLLREGHL